MNLEEVKKFLEDNKEQEEVKRYLGELSKPTVEGVKGFLDTPEGKKLLQPRLDQHFTKGLETWKANNLESLVDAEVQKRNPTKTPEQLEIEKLRKEIEDEKKARNRETLVNKALKIADEKQLPKGIVDFFIADDEENTVANLSKLEEEYSKAVKTAVEAKFKESGRDFQRSEGKQSANISDIAQMAQEANIINK